MDFYGLVKCPERNPRGTKYTGEIEIKVARALFCPDGKDHFILRDKTNKIYADTTNPVIVKRTRWIIEKDLEQYWTAKLTYDTVTKHKSIRLIKKIKNLGWDDYEGEQ